MVTGGRDYGGIKGDATYGLPLFFLTYLFTSYCDVKDYLFAFI
jgi:hypothetical protein